VARLDDGYREIGPAGLNLDLSMIEAMVTRMVLAAPEATGPRLQVGDALQFRGLAGGRTRP